MTFRRLATLALAGLALAAAAGCRQPWSPAAPGSPAAGSVTVQYFGASMVAVGDRVHTVVVDPFQPHVGFPVPKVAADVVLVSEDRLDLNNIRAVGGSPRVFTQPGIFVTGQLTIQGIPSTGTAAVTREPNVMFRWRMERMEFAHLGDLASDALTPQQEALLSGLDVMFVPVGGKFTMDATQATQLIRRLAPKVAIPIHYRTGPSTMAIAYVDAFLAQWPHARRAPSAFTISSGQLPKKTEIWLMDWR